MAGYFVTLIDTMTDGLFEEYSTSLSRLIARHDGTIAASGGERACLEGPDVPSRIVLVEFETLEQGEELYASAAHKDWINTAGARAEFVSFAVEGEPQRDFSRPQCYFIARLNILDLEGYEAYSAKAAPLLKNWDAVFVAAGPLVNIIGQSGYEKFVLIRFPNLDSARQFHRSPAYKAVAPMRKLAAEMQQFAVAGTL